LLTTLAGPGPVAPPDNNCTPAGTPGMPKENTGGADHSAAPPKSSVQPENSAPLKSTSPPLLADTALADATQQAEEAFGVTIGLWERLP
jgi:hypothetical protein